MNVNLLRAIRLSKLRTDSAIEYQKRLNPKRDFLIRYLRVFNPLLKIPFSLDKSFHWYLDGDIQKQSKTGVAYSELIDAGLDPNTIWHQGEKPENSRIKLLRLFKRLPNALVLLFSRSKSVKKLDIASVQVLIGYSAYRNLFLKHPDLKPVVISDVSPRLHMQWAGALAAGNKVMWWQDDYHHFKGFSSENYLPYKCHFAVVLNELGMKTAKEKCSVHSIFKRGETFINPLRLISDNPKVGFASNVFFRADNERLKRLDEIRHKFGVNQIYCRLHPNSKLHTVSGIPKWLRLAPKEETLNEFVRDVDLVIVGNSAVQLKFLCLGVPVVHVADFDLFGFDLYKYCKLGFSYGAKNLTEIDLNEIRSFYKDERIKERLDEYVNVKSSVHGLNKLNSFINN